MPMEEKGGAIRRCQSREIEAACMGAKGKAGRRCIVGSRALGWRWRGWEGSR